MQLVKRESFTISGTELTETICATVKHSHKYMALLKKKLLSLNFSFSRCGITS